MPCLTGESALASIVDNFLVFPIDILYARVDTTVMESTERRPISLRCRAEKNATADRFQKVQCPSHASTEAKLNGVADFPVCARHAARTANLYTGRDWRRAI